jgi:hypothetical protein
MGGIRTQISPYNEPNDIVYPASYDQPSYCEEPFYLSKGECHSFWTDTQPVFSPPMASPDPGVMSCRGPN